MMLARWLAALAALAMATPAVAGDKIKYAKTEVEKARGKCVGSVIGGALLGALIGRAVDKRGAVAGAAIGAAAGVGLCAVLMRNAKQQDRIMAAQLAVARNPARAYQDSWVNDEGSTTSIRAAMTAEEQVDGARLIPVRYHSLMGAEIASPVLPAGPQDCRKIDAVLSDDKAGNGSVGQIYCRTPSGDYQPYAYKAA